MTHAIRMLRALDGILYSSVILLLLLLHPTAGRDVFGGYDLLCALPVFALAWFALCVPMDFLKSSAWRLNVHRLRIAALLFAGVSPFAIWWSQQPGDLYLLINFALFVGSGAALVFLLNRAYEYVCRDAGPIRLLWETKLSRNLAFWLLNVVGVGLVLLILLISWFLPDRSSPGEVLAMIFGLNYGGVLFMQSRITALVAALVLMTPMVFFLSLTFRLRLALKQQIDTKQKE